MNEISNSNTFEEFEILKDEEKNLDLTSIKRCNNIKNINLYLKKRPDKIYEEDNEINNNIMKPIILKDDNEIINEDENNNQETRFLINNQINEEKKIIEDENTSETFNKIEEDNKEIDKIEEILDFENIELKETERGDFTEITISSLSSEKSKSKEEKIKEQNDLLFSLYQELNFGNNNIINNNGNQNFGNKNNILSKTCIELGRKNSSNKKLDLIKTMSVLKSTKTISWKDNFKSFMSSIYYNGYALAKKFDKNNPDIPLYIFDTKIVNLLKIEINFLLKTFLYMSYRSGLVNLNSIGGGDFTSDCGWGCMLRCCQMMLSKGIIQKKINDFYKKENKSPISFKILENIRKETLFLFSDSYLHLKDIKNHPDFKHYFELYQNLTKTNSEYKSISEVIPPYSIHILCILGQISCEYTSDIKIVKLFTKINAQLFPDFNILFFECGLISKSKIISAFCEEYIESDKSKINNFDTITYNGIDYIFKKEGIVFISFRFGLNELDPNYYDIIPLFFEKFKNNIGFVSGKKNKAYYFVGIDSNKKLIFFDPHYNQQINHDLEKDYESYFTENIYLLDMKNMSSELTLGIGIYNSNQFTQFLDTIKWFADNFKDKCIISFSKE